MNASAYLRDQGWRGDGYSLDQSNRGLTRPLSVSHKVDLLGLGKKKNDFTNQWWLDAFDKSLDKFGSGEAVPEFNPRSIATRTALYSSFVKSETLASTLGTTPATTSSTSSGEVMSPAPGASTKAEVDSSTPNLKQNGHQSEKKEKKGKKADKKSDKEERRSHKQDKLKKLKKLKREEIHEPEIKTAADGSSQEEVSKAKDEMRHSKKRKYEDDSSESDVSESDESELDESESNHSKEPAPDGGSVNGPQEKKIKLRPVDKELRDAEAQLQERGEPHAESIAALKAKGELVELPGDLKDGTPLGQVIRAYQNQNLRLIKKILAATWPTPPKINEKELRRQGLPIVKPSKKAKYKRESNKRKLKRAARYWVKVRQHPALYRPNATSVSRDGDYDPFEEIEDKKKKKKAKKQKDVNPMLTDEDRKRIREERERAKAEWEARRQLRREMQAEKRAAKKLVRSEKKRLNHEKVQQHIAAKVRQKKEEKERAQAADLGLSYEEFLAERKKRMDAERVIRETERAKSLGMTYEELQAQKRSEHEARRAEKERKRAEREKGEESRFDEDEFYDSEIGEYFGNSALDMVWKDKQKEAKRQAEAASAVAPTNGPADIKDDSANGKAAALGGAAGDDYISLNAPGVGTSAILPFAIDTNGEQSLAPGWETKPVKEMTKAERRARLEQIRAKRAERKAKQGLKPVNKKQVRKVRAQRKQELLDKMTNDILDRRRREKGTVSTDTTGPNATPYMGDQFRGKKKTNPLKDLTKEQREERNSAKRTARKMIKEAKKGKAPSEGFPQEFDALYGRNKRVKKANYKPFAHPNNAGGLEDGNA